MRVLTIVALISVLANSLCSADDEKPFDILIKGGQVVDGTGNPWIRADVGIRGDRIAAVGALNDAKATQIINARGLIVAPGFIDIHSHSDFLLFKDGNAESKIR